MKNEALNILKLGTLPVLAFSLASCGGGGGGGESGGGSNEPTGAPAAGEITLDAEAIGFPKPQFIGTPVPPGNIPNLEKPGDPKTSVNVAEGSTLISVGKPVTSSEEFEPVIGSLEYITDGDKEGGDGYYVELGPDLQWVQIDLESEATVEAIIVWHFHKQERVYRDFIVQISSDPEFATGVTTVYNNDHDNSAGMGEGKDLAYIETNHGRIIDTNGATARYVRLYSNGNTSDDLNHYVEVAVYGKAGG